jgi:predicted dehydrogenase
MKFLICGLGHMGKIHKKYLENLNVEWMYYDPYYTEDLEHQLKDLKKHADYDITHVIVSSVEEKHYENYNTLRNSGFTGPILLEKPAVLLEEQFKVFEDEKVSVGLVERHNPVIDILKNNIVISDVISVDFTRCSVKSVSNKRVDTFTDVGIHDLDLYFYLFDKRQSPSDYHFSWFSNTFNLAIKEKEGFMSRFMWSNETSFKERKIVVRHGSFTITADLIRQEVTKASADDSGRCITQNLYVEKGSSILNQILKFKKHGITCKGLESHKFYLKLRRKINDY